MGWLERLGQAIRANINSSIEEAEDPEKVLEEMVLNLEQELIRMRQGLAEAIATVKRTERESQKQLAAAQTWYERAQIALNQNNEVLARQALVQWQIHHSSSQSIISQLQEQNQIINGLKKNLRELEQKYAEIKTKKSFYLARLRTAAASQKMNDIMGNLHNRSAATIFERIETKILEMESHSELITTTASDPLEQQFAALEGEKIIEAQLTEMKIKPMTTDQ